MGFQKCPVCNGTGRHSDFGLTDATCPVCEGKRIINEMTGRPPQDSKPTIREKMVNPVPGLGKDQSGYRNPYIPPYEVTYTGSPVVDAPTNILDYVGELNRLAKNFELRINLSDIDGKEKE